MTREMLATSRVSSPCRADRTPEFRKLVNLGQTAAISALYVLNWYHDWRFLDRVQELAQLAAGVFGAEWLAKSLRAGAWMFAALAVMRRTAGDSGLVS